MDKKLIDNILKDCLPDYDYIHKTDEYHITKRALEKLRDHYENRLQRVYPEDDSFSINM